MSTALAKNSHRDHGELKTITMKLAPLCPACKHPMGICKRKQVKLVGLTESYKVSIPTYGCRKNACPKRMKNLVTPPNPYAAPRMTYDYAVQTEVVVIRWHEHATHLEIAERLESRFGIRIDHYAIETILKSYEIGATKTYRSDNIEMMRFHGGVFVCVDVMEPLQGKKGFLVAYDYWTGITLGAKKMPNGKQATYEVFLKNIETRIKNELELPIIGIISDALPTQRKAIAAAFPEIPHCLCHYHFYNYVLRDAKLADSGIVTQIRKRLRSNYDIRQYKLRVSDNTLLRSQYDALEPLFAPLEELSHWSRKPRDPCFTGLELWLRLEDITQKFIKIEKKVNNTSIHLPKHSVKVVKRLTPLLMSLLNNYRALVEELSEIHSYLGEMVNILSSTESNATIGLKQMLHLIDRLDYSNLDSSRGLVVAGFIQGLKKYIETKGQLLFNYRSIPEAPNTNNFQELKFKQLKHFLRRVIGHGAAKDYLMAHGERIVFINPTETREGIRLIFESSDQTVARREIRKNRRKMDSWVFVIHNRVKWAENMKKIDVYIDNLEKKLFKRS